MNAETATTAEIAQRELSKRKEKETSLAEELGMTRQALNAEYIKSYLYNYAEFNPDLVVAAPSVRIEERNNEIASLKSANKELALKYKASKFEVKSLRAELKKVS